MPAFVPSEAVVLGTVVQPAGGAMSRIADALEGDRRQQHVAGLRALAAVAIVSEVDGYGALAETLRAHRRRSRRLLRRAVAAAAAGVGERLAGLRDELPVVARRLQRQLDHAVCAASSKTSLLGLRVPRA